MNVFSPFWYFNKITNIAWRKRNRIISAQIRSRLFPVRLELLTNQFIGGCSTNLAIFSYVRWNSSSLTYYIICVQGAYSVFIFAWEYILPVLLFIYLYGHMHVVIRQSGKLLKTNKDVTATNVNLVYLIDEQMLLINCRI